MDTLCKILRANSGSDRYISLHYNSHSDGTRAGWVIKLGEMVFSQSVGMTVRPLYFPTEYSSEFSSSEQTAAISDLAVERGGSQQPDGRRSRGLPSEDGGAALARTALGTLGAGARCRLGGFVWKRTPR